MAVNVTSEVASIHRSLRDLCEKFETSVDELCASSPQSIRPHEFYECECVPIAAECVDALSGLQSASSYEGTAYQNAIAAADSALRQQKRELEENVAQRAKIYEDDIAAADSALRQRKRELEENAAQSVITVQSEVEEFSDAAEAVGVDFSDLTGVDAKELLEKTTVRSSSKTYYRKALAEAKRHDFNLVLYFLSFVAITTVWILVLTFLFSDPVPNGFFFVGGILSAMLAIICYKNKKNKIAKALGTLGSPAIEECDVIREDMQNAVTNALAARDKAVEDLHARKEREDKQAAETATNALAAHDKKINKERSKRDQAIAYIQREHQAFDTRLCQCLDKFQSLVDIWIAENVPATSILDGNRVQNLSRNSEEIKSCLTRVGTVGIWGPFGVVQHGAKVVKSVPTIQPMEYADDAETVKHYLQAIANDDATVQPVRLVTVGRDDLKTVKSYLQAIANVDNQGYIDALISLNGLAEQGHAEALKYLNRLAEQGHAEALKYLNGLAEQGHAEVQLILGSMYKNGEGVRQDDSEAVKWYRKAAEQGHEGAKKAIDRRGR